MVLEQLMEPASELLNNPYGHWYLTNVAGMYAGKIAVELSGHWRRRQQEISELCGDPTAKRYRRSITTMNMLPFPLDIIYAFKMMFN